MKIKFNWQVDWFGDEPLRRLVKHTPGCLWMDHSGYELGLCIWSLTPSSLALPPCAWLPDCHEFSIFDLFHPSRVMFLLGPADHGLKPSTKLNFSSFKLWMLCIMSQLQKTRPIHFS